MAIISFTIIIWLNNNTLHSKSDNIRDVPQGSMLGLILLIMSINEIDDCVRSTISKFANDTKILNRFQYGSILQDDFNTSIDRQLCSFNAAKYKCLYVGSKNLKLD